MLRRSASGSRVFCAVWWAALLSALTDLRASAFAPFDDTVLFYVNWQSGAKMPESLLGKHEEGSLSVDEAVVMTSADNEQYVCQLPRPADAPDAAPPPYTGRSPGQLIRPLYDQRSCTYRIEIYWTYELCHGRFLLQYHEDKDSATRRPQRKEYYLGQYMSDVAAADDAAFDAMQPPQRRVDDQRLPYYPVSYVQGALCDLTKKPRTATIHYVCMADAKNQIYSFYEVSTCDYELVVLTPLLCAHPAFRPQRAPEHAVDCFALADSPERPYALTVWQRESSFSFDKRMLERQLQSMWQRQQRGAVPPAAKSTVPLQRVPKTSQPQPPAPVDKALLSSFLAGETCLHGGSGWWKHTYCHQRQVIQYHEDARTGRLEILLGRWSEPAHLQWIATREHKQPVEVEEKIRQVSHFYGGGDVCDVTGQPRTVEVRLRCRETAADSNAVTLYLLEPKSCEYVLGVDSPMFCDVLQTADKRGLLHPTA